ncbi:MAG: SIMPL domain-containing protein [Pyrinomonadaceae bacterium]
MKSRNFLALLILAVSTVTLTAACGAKEKRTTSRVMVTGEASAQTPPDTAVVVLSVVTQNQRALDAQQQNARKSDAVIQAVKETAGANPEIKTSNYSLQPQQSYRSNAMPSIIGYEARNTVTVTTSELNNVGALIDAATHAGANSVEGVAFTLRETSPARAQTLAEASKQAMGKAQAMAQALNGHVTRVVEEQEGGFQNSPTTTDEEQGYNDKFTADSIRGNFEMKRSPRTPVESGSLNVRAQVQLIVEIEVQP